MLLNFKCKIQIFNFFFRKIFFYIYVFLYLISFYEDDDNNLSRKKFRFLYDNDNNTNSKNLDSFYDDINNINLRRVINIFIFSYPMDN